MSKRVEGDPVNINPARFSRAHFLRLATIGALSLTNLSSLSIKSEPSLTRPESLGVTFSQLQCRYLQNQNPEQTFKFLLGLNFDWYRLCGYWNEEEITQGNYDFGTVRKFIELAEEDNPRRKSEGLDPIKLIVTHGAFSPRYPEVHISPYIIDKLGNENLKRTDQTLDKNKFLADRLLLYVQRGTEDLKQYSSVQVVQIGNESLSGLPTAAGLKLSHDFFANEVDVVSSTKRLDQKSLIANPIDLFPLLPDDSETVKLSIQKADIIGTNVYDRVPLPKGLGYYEPLPDYWQKLTARRELIEQAGKEAWITEAQAEPWEDPPNRKLEVPSSSPKRMQNLTGKLLESGFNTVIYWGGEWWYYCLSRNNPSWSNGIQKQLAATLRSRV